MKIVLLADLHLGSSDHLSRTNPTTGLPTRLEDFLATFDQIVNYAIDPVNDIKMFIIAGDIYKTRQPTNTQQSEFAKRLKILSDAGLHVKIVDGNHDILVGLGGAATSEIYKSLQVPNIEVKAKPAIESYDDTAILYMPYAHKGKLGFDTNQELIDWYTQKVRRFVEKADSLNATTKIVIGHQTLEGTVFLSGQNTEKIPELVVPLEIFEGTHFVIYGHVHKYQVLNNKDPYILVPGSPDTLDFSEAEEDKGFTVFDTDTHEVKRFPLETKSLMQLDIVFDGTESLEELTNIAISQIRDIPNLADTIVKTVITLPETIITHFDLGAINKELDKAAFALRPVLDIKRVRRVRNQAITEILPIEDTMRAYFEKREDLQDILDDLVLAGRTIIATTQSEEL